MDSSRSSSERCMNGWNSTSARVRSGYVAAYRIAMEQPSCEPSSTAFSEPTASSTLRMSSIRVSKVGS